MLYYIHGYQSSPNSAKARLFREKLNVQAIAYHYGKPEELVISDCLKRISEEIEEDREVVLIGSSLGGFLAAEIALENSFVKSLVLLNPLLIPPSQDVSKIEGIPARILYELRDDRLFVDKMRSETTVLIATDDELLPPNWVLEFAMAQEATVRFLHDDHSFTRHLCMLPSIVHKITKESGANRDRGRVPIA
jgi:predicted esterase YcpF (UPF0227 family)